MMIRRFVFGMLCLLTVAGVKAQDITVGSFNLRYDNHGDSGNLWVNRAPQAAALIRFHDYDIVGTQEGLQNQLDDLDSQLSDYTYYGIGRDDGKKAGEHSAIFYKKDRFKLLDKGDFWLSQTPEKPGPGWDAHLNRICSWVYLEDKQSKKRFYFFNVHYDHQGVEARKESSKLILRKIKEIAGNAPAILTGDFNGDYNSAWYQTVARSGQLEDTHSLAAHPYDNNPSFNGFGSQLQRTGIIDHVFVTSQFGVYRWGIVTDSYHGKYPSDHFPILVKLTWK